MKFSKNTLKDVRIYLALFLMIWLRILTHTSSHGISYWPAHLFEIDNVIAATIKSSLIVGVITIVASILLFMANKYDQWNDKKIKNRSM